MSERVRVTFAMRRADYDDLRRSADSEGETVTGYIRKAVAAHRYVRDRQAAGAALLVEESGTQREVRFL